MYTSVALIAALLSATTAAPVAQWSNQGPPPPSSSSSASSPPLKDGNPFSFPLSNGFNGQLAGQALTAANIQAHGIQPNGGAPTLGTDDLTSVQLIAFNEIFEVAFFTSLLTNVTNSVSGFYVNDNGATKAAITAIQAQEELHANNANAILVANNLSPIQPCQYKFPTSSLSSALALAKTFTDLVLGTLQDVQLHLATNGAAGVVPVIGSVIGQEGEQTGFFRSSAGLIPSSKPFLTRAAREFAFSALNQNFVVPGSCPNVKDINLPIFKPLTVVTQNVQPMDQKVSFSVSAQDLPSLDGLSVVYINGQSTPIVEPIENVKTSYGMITFEAQFPFNEFVMEGLTVVALTKGSGPFKAAGDVAKSAVAGPGLIEID